MIHISCSKFVWQTLICFQARIQEFSSGGGGPHFQKIWQAKKKKKKKKKKKRKERKRNKNEGCGGSFPLQKLDFQTDFYRQLFTYKGFFCRACFLYNCKPLSRLHKYTDDMVVLILFMCRGGGLAVLPQNIFGGLNDIKSCNWRQEKSENALS